MARLRVFIQKLSYVVNSPCSEKGKLLRQLHWLRLSACVITSATKTGWVVLLVQWPRSPRHTLKRCSYNLRQRKRVQEQLTRHEAVDGLVVLNSQSVTQVNRQ